jgi:hypothetical protein
LEAAAVRAARDDTVPRARASAHLKRRTLATRLSALTERHIGIGCASQAAIA